MEVLIILVAVIVAFVFIAKSSSATPPTTEQLDQYTGDQLRGREYKIVKQLTKLSTESVNIALNVRATDADLRRHEKLQEQIATLEQERKSIKAKLSKLNNATG